MKNNKGLTLVELIIVMASLSMVTIFFWTILNSSSEDSYTINDKIEVQTSVTSLMNAIQQDIQEAKIVVVNIDNAKYGVGVVEAEYEYKISPEKGSNSKESCIKYEFDSINKKVIREVIKSGDVSQASDYNDIQGFSMTFIEDGKKYGADVEITGGKKDGSSTDKSRYELNATYYTRNTAKPIA